jgi:MFS transporter, YNFM family, putative membrane transport protein
VALASWPVRAGAQPRASRARTPSGGSVPVGDPSGC